MSPRVAPKIVKRKRAATKHTPTKRPRSESSPAAQADESPQPQLQNQQQHQHRVDVLALETAILDSKKNYNNITALIDLARAAGELNDNHGQDALLAAVALCRVFIRLLAAGALVGKKGMPDKDVVVVHWLRDRFSEVRKVILLLFTRDEQAMTALALAMRLLKAEGQHPLSDKEEYAFPKATLKEIIVALSQPEVDPFVRKEFVVTFVDEFEDVRLYTFKALHDTIGTPANALIRVPSFEAVFELLSSIKGVPASAEELEDFYIDPPTQKKGHKLFSVSKHKKQAQAAWLALMRMEMSKDQRKQLLDVMTDIIVPWFIQPELLMDFLTDCYDTGGSMSLLALSGVFYLIQERNLDYPAFYAKLYSLLDAEILHSRYRSRFFRLLDTFLSSSHLPAALVASFVKRFARLSLNAPPSAIVIIIPWMYNLFKRHPACTFMMHQTPRTETEKQKLTDEGLEDPFLPHEEDPMETGAINSCIWEIVQLQSHYHPNVATIAKIVSEQFTKQIYNTEDFLDHSYGSLLEAEMGKNLKRAPVVEFSIPKRVFLPEGGDLDAEDSLLPKLWGPGRTCRGNS